MKRILLIGLGIATLIPIIWAGADPTSFVACVYSLTHSKAPEAQATEPKAAKTPEDFSSVKSNAEDLGHLIALNIENGHPLPTASDLFALCALEAEKHGYKDDQYERFINIAQRQVTKELHKEFGQ